MVAALRIIGPGPVDVLADIEIRETVTIQVRPGGARCPQSLGQTGLFRDLGKAAAAFAVRLIAIQGHPAPARDQQIGPAVAVVIAYRAAVCVKESRRAGIQADLPGHVAEFAFAQVLVKPAAMALDVVQVLTGVIAPARKEDVQQSVAIVVDKATTPSHGFDKILCPRSKRPTPPASHDQNHSLYTRCKDGY